MEQELISGTIAAVVYQNRISVFLVLVYYRRYGSANQFLLQ